MEIVKLDKEALKAALPPCLLEREETVSKHDCGRALLLVGSKQYVGAAFLALGSCLRSGVGYAELNADPLLLNLAPLVYPSALYSVRQFAADLTAADFALYCSELSKLLKESLAYLPVPAAFSARNARRRTLEYLFWQFKRQRLARVSTKRTALLKFLGQLLRADAVLLGSGRGLSLATLIELSAAIVFAANLVIDADALSCLGYLRAQMPTFLSTLLAWRNLLGLPQVLLTPHIGELKNLATAFLAPALRHADWRLVLEIWQNLLSEQAPAVAKELATCSTQAQQAVAVAAALSAVCNFKIVIKGAPTCYFAPLKAGTELRVAAKLSNSATAFSNTAGQLQSVAAQLPKATISSFPKVEDTAAQAVKTQQAASTQLEKSDMIAGELTEIEFYTAALQRFLAADNHLWRNSAGNNALAKAGSGDVLAGLLTAYLADKNLTPDIAVLLAVFLHGRTADIAVSRQTARTLLPHELAHYLSAALTELLAADAL